MTERTRRIVAAVFMAALGLTAAMACSAPAASPANSEGSAATSREPAPAVPTVKPEPTACELVTADEMSAILGSRVGVKIVESFTGQTTCQYSPPEGFSPAAQLRVEWGMAEPLMGAAAKMNQVEPGITNPYAGIGDQAVIIGGNLLIRKGDDVLTVSFLGVANEAAAARRVYETAAKRM